MKRKPGRPRLEPETPAHAEPAVTPTTFTVTTADLQHEFLTVAEVATLTRHDADSVRRWIETGIKSSRGQIRLASLRVGGKRLIRRDAVDAFLTALNPEPMPVPESPAAFRRRALAEQEQALRMVGVISDED